MGLLIPAELKALRQSLGLTQSEMAEYLQAGQKSYTRWELGYGRQSRLVNNFLLLLKTGKINLTHLRRPKGMTTWNRVFHSQQTAKRAVVHSAYNGGDAAQSNYSQCEQQVSHEAVAA
jgi:DNA-binding XRE family transcriptional regulator